MFTKFENRYIIENDQEKTGGYYDQKNIINLKRKAFMAKRTKDYHGQKIKRVKVN